MSAGWVVTAIYSRSGYFNAPGGRVVRGGYDVHLIGTPGHGYGATLDGALDDLARALEAWVAPLGAPDCGSRVREVGRAGAASAVRSAAAGGTLREALGAAVREPVLDPDDEPVPDPSDGPRRVERSASAADLIEFVTTMRPVG